MPESAHRPVMGKEVLEALRVEAGGTYADGTLGGAGLAGAILEASVPNGWLYGCDLDGGAVEAARERLARFAGRFEVRQGNFADLAEWVPRGSCEGMILDLGFSSDQIAAAERGLSFQRDGPLDMRFNTQEGISAAQIVNEWDADELAKIFWRWGGEPQSRRLAREIARQREKARLETTLQLAQLIERVCPRRGRTHPATGVFQALRMAVNAEISSLERGLQGALRILKPGGRLAVISFHSIEDAVVKNWARERARDYVVRGGGPDVPELREARAPEVKIVSRKAIKPRDEEVLINPRSRSAQLRVVEKM